MEIDLPNGGNRPARLILGFFALVGFLASVVTITQYFSSSESSLSVTVQQHKFRTPYYSGRALQSNQPSRLLSDDLRKTLCKNFSDDQILNIEFSKISDTFGAKKEDAENCKKAQDIEFASRWLGEFSSSDAALYEYDIKNDGEKPADGIRIRSTGLNTAQYSADDEKFVELKSKDGEGYYTLPNLNPGESFKVFAWSNSSFYDSPYRTWDELPAVTYSGAQIHTEFMRPMPDGWYNIYDLVSDAPWIISLFLVVAAAFAIVFVFIGIIGLIQAAVTGKPFSEIFKSNDSSDAGQSGP